MGSATASLQIEGGDTNNSWYEWSRQGHIADGTTSCPATDHWNRVEEDIALMKKMNHSVYRMSLEWSRIEPSQGHFSAAAIRHYRDEIKSLIKAKIRPMVTLHHFSNPLWFEHTGGWLRDDAPLLFESYVVKVVDSLGDLVSDWVTINEPNVYLTKGYLFGEWPPAHSQISEYFKGASKMIEAHKRAYVNIHRIRHDKGRGDTRAGAAHHLRIFDPKTFNPLDLLVARVYEHLFQGMFVEAMTTGKTPLPLEKEQKLPFREKRYSDFLGINYYTRDMVSFTLDKKVNFGKLSLKKGAATNDLGWEIYPEGLYRILNKYAGRYSLPVYITENGTSDRKDAFRTRFIYDHLFQLKRAIDSGVDVKAYCHWTLVDNFEWNEGFTARFGLAELKKGSLQRKIRPSGEFYAGVCAEKKVSEEMIERYLKK